MRDILVLPFCAKKIVIYSDCAASIGESKEDIIKADPFLVGKYTARVALFEVLCVGAEPFAIINNISTTKGVERIIEGIESEADNVHIFGSTESNFPSKVTFLSVFCIGFANELRIGRSRSGDLVIAIGVPSVGYEVVKNEKLLPDLKTVKSLLNMGVHDIIPTGSRGVAYEIDVLEAETGLEFVKTNESFPYDKSCGPSSVLVVTLSEKLLDRVKQIGKPISILGRLR